MTNKDAQLPLVTRNKEKKKEYDRQYKREHKERHTEVAREYYQKIKENLVVFFGNACASCNGTYHQSNYDFHHLDPKEKDFTLAKATGLKMALEESKKCIMLCANCHRTIHAQLDYNLTGY